MFTVFILRSRGIVQVDLMNYISIDGLVKSQRHQLLEKIGCSEYRVLKGTRVSNRLMTPKSDCILHPVDFLRDHHKCINY